MNTIESKDVVKLINTEKGILEYMKANFDRTSDTTFENFLNTFKQILFYYECQEYNPSLFPITWKKPTFKREVSLIHRKMYKFLCNAHYIKLKYQGNSITCKWSVQTFFMPILSAYIFTTIKHCKEKKKISARDFFKEMEEYITNDKLSKTVIESETKAITYCDLYKRWLTEGLGKDYFCNLEILLNTYSKTNEQFEELYNSVWPLTDMHLSLCEYPSKLNAYLNTLLENQIKEIHDILSNANEEGSKLDSLYDSLEPFTPASIQTFFYNLSNSYNEEIYKLINYAQHYITANGNSDLYPLSIKNFSIFEKQYRTLLEEFDAYHNSQKQVIQNYFYSFESSDEINELRQNGLIWIDVSLLPKYIECCSKELDKQYCEIQKSSRELLKNTKISSGNTKAKNENPEYIHGYNLTHWINEMDFITNNTKTRLIPKLHKLPPFIYKNNQGLCESLKYPLFDWSEKTFIKTMHILKPETCSLSDRILLEKTKLSFPITKETYMNFLHNLDTFNIS